MKTRSIEAGLAIAVSLAASLAGIAAPGCSGGGASGSTGGPVDDAGPVDASDSGTADADGPADSGPDSDGGDAGDGAPPEVSCQALCDEVAINCTGKNQQYLSSSGICLTECATLSKGAFGDAQNTVGCRQFQGGAPAVTDPKKACAAAGASGGGICSTRCEAYCANVFAACVPAHHDAVNPYSSMAACQDACKAFTFDPAAPEYDSNNHDTLNCRQFYLQQAWSDTAGGSALIHCPDVDVKTPNCSDP